MWKLGISAHKFNNNKIQKINEQIIVEKKLRLFLNNELIYSTLSTPHQRKELAIGYLLANKLIRDPESIQSISDDKDDLKVSLKKASKLSEEKIIATLELSPDTVISLMAMFQDNANLYKATGTAYSSALCTKNNIINFSEDINRVNALYKIIGQAALKETALDDKLIILSGKICSKITNTLLNLGISTIISRTGCTDKAFHTAKDNNITIIGFARGKHFTIFTGRENFS